MGLPGIPRGANGAPRRSTRTRQAHSIGGASPRQVRPIGTVWPAQKKPDDKVREPLVDVFDEGDVLLVIVELPGVNEKDIKIEVEDDRLSVATRTPGRRFAAELYLPCPVGVVESTTRMVYWKSGYGRRLNDELSYQAAHRRRH